MKYTNELKVNQFFYYNILFNIKYTTMREMSEQMIYNIENLNKILFIYIKCT